MRLRRSRRRSSPRFPEPVVGKARRSKPPEGLPPYLASLDDVPLLSREQEAHLFRKMNYLKFRVNQMRATIDPTRVKPAVLDSIERLMEEALAVKNQIIRANLRLVVSIAKKHPGAGEQLLRVGLRRQHVADPGRGEI